jgi:phage baseplate assembly protein W
MTTLVKDITTKHWSISSTVLNEVVTGVNDLKQCVFNILMTVKGSDPLRPEFGCTIFRYMDKPVKKVLPLMMKAITDAIQLYEPRVTVVKVSATVTNLSEIIFDIEMDAALGNFALGLKIGRDPFDARSGKYIITEVGDYVVDGNLNRIIYV